MTPGTKNTCTLQDGVAIMELTHGKSMRMAEKDLPLLAPHKWFALRKRNATTWYAVANVRRQDDGRRAALGAHRLIMGLDFGDPREVDHINGDGLNNLRSNLRVTDGAGNQHNLHGKRRWLDGRAPTSRFPGVSWSRQASKWCAQICLRRQRIHLGFYDMESDAAKAYLWAKAARDAGGTCEEIQL